MHGNLHGVGMMGHINRCAHHVPDDEVFLYKVADLGTPADTQTTLWHTLGKTPVVRPLMAALASSNQGNPPTHGQAGWG
jgi:hypothetical protein